ncbi:MAG: hypothetical protein Nk1A_8090 [Endomicrobiia bacterium]|nr:MAG: hypothetical protein Nk1A_8090 [Endomicrobiia bacterium]
MQSFMNMKLVGFIDTPTNICLVPCHQFWIQGSDLDIDKGFILGCSISESGFYNDWSKLFNYSSKLTVDASNVLPIPDKKTRILVQGKKVGELEKEVPYGHAITTAGEVVSCFVDYYGNTIDTTGI